MPKGNPAGYLPNVKADDKGKKKAPKKKGKRRYDTATNTFVSK